MSYRNLKRADWQNYLDTYTPMGYRITHFDVKVVGGEPRFDLDMAKRTGPAWRIRTNLTTAEFENLSREMANNGYVVRRHRAYTVNGALLNAVMYEKE